MNYTVKTNVKALKTVWNVLKEMDINGLLDGTTVTLNPSTIINKLLSDGKLNEVCRAITGKDDDFEELELQEVVMLFVNFFASIGKSLKELTPLITAQVNPQNQPESN